MHTLKYKPHALPLSVSYCVWYIFHRPQWAEIPHGGPYSITIHDSQTHSSHALTGSHTVDSPSSSEVINDFLWLPSNSPSIVNPLFLIEATLPLCYLCPSFWRHGRMDSDASSGEQECRRRVIFMIDWGSSRFRRHCMCWSCVLIKYVHLPRVKSLSDAWVLRTWLVLQLLQLTKHSNKVLGHKE